MRFAGLIVLLFVMMGCGKEKAKPQPQFQSYDFEAPARQWALPYYMNETSGLTYLSKDRLAMVTDEIHGFFVFDLTQGKIVDTVTTGGKGDVEGIASYRDTVWLIESNGRLSTFSGGTWQYDSLPISNPNNPEGLEYDSIGHQLLIALKGKPIHTKQTSDREILRYNPKTQSLDSIPALTIQNETLRRHPLIVNQPFANKGKKKHPPVLFPSAVAIHPKDHLIYVLSAERTYLAVYKPDGNLVDLFLLPKNLLPKPEGMAFAPDGTIYLATENGCPGCTAKLFEFKMNAQ